MRAIFYPSPSDRARPLEAERNRKMATSAHAYVRGSTVKFYEWLEASGRRALPAGPPIWICGDCHVGNLGPIGGADGTLVIEIRDLDQTVIGNPAHDLIRLGLSLATAARGSDLPGVTTAHMLECLIEGYEAAFAAAEQGEALNEAVTMPQVVRAVMRKAAGRFWKHLADERIEGVEPVIPLGKRFWPLTREERDAIDALFAEPATARLMTALRSRADDAEVRVLDAAYWRKGCSSLGVQRYAVLVAIGRGRAERHCLVDVKQAIAPSAPHAPAPHAGASAMPEDNGERVVTGARALSPVLGGRMLHAHLLGCDVFLRELLPQDLKLEIEHLTRADAMEVSRYLAHVVGRSHARQMNPAAEASWLDELQRNRSRTLDAPSWLWDSVVDLSATHEAAYLNHCRRYALAAA